MKFMAAIDRLFDIFRVRKREADSVWADVFSIWMHFRAVENIKLGNLFETEVVVGVANRSMKADGNLHNTFFMQRRSLVLQHAKKPKNHRHGHIRTLLYMQRAEHPKKVQNIPLFSALSHIIVIFSTLSEEM